MTGKKIQPTNPAASATPSHTDDKQAAGRRTATAKVHGRKTANAKIHSRKSSSIRTGH